MRRTLAILALVVLAGSACSDGGDQGPGTATPTSVDRDAPLPAAVASFVDEFAEPGSVAFRGSYRVLKKLGGTETTIEVVADPPEWQVRAGDLLFADGPETATCRLSAQRCVGQVQEQLLSDTGVFSRFFATAPAQALATDARRATAGPLERSERDVAGVALRCAGVPLSGLVASTYCLTAEGVVGWADTPAVHYELTSYVPGPPGEAVRVPFPVSHGVL